ncbi:poly(ADP-ribose) glycohydrolase-like [Pseudonaja textilis]|uniref:poly(ADP-ribose) glycohydrolase-like n=1 Tax=Pseudonaja textilis TaxID=8673 RepID=UPI000EAA7C20|nr:poly(ADP-ribose) glycohydrolase-like [Pseudonaja textilis]
MSAGPECEPPGKRARVEPGFFPSSEAVVAQPPPPPPRRREEGPPGPGGLSATVGNKVYKQKRITSWMENRGARTVDSERKSEGRNTANSSAHGPKIPWPTKTAVK